jgi:tetratricopeptide (TPR) repeat protein
VLGAFLCCLAGAAVLPAVRYLGRESPPAEKPEAAGAEQEALPESVLRSPEEEIKQIDEWIQEGRYEAALTRCRPLIEAATAATRNALEYRAGLCLEGLGRPQPAIEVYRAVATRVPFSRAGAAAQLSQARCWLRLSRSDDAKALLSTLILRSAEPALHDHALLSDAFYLLAIALTLEATPAAKPGPLEGSTVAHPVAELPVELMLDWVTLTEPAVEAAEEREADFVSVRRLGARPEDVLVSAAASQGSVLDFLERVAWQAELQVRWSDEAKLQVAGRSLDVSIEQMPLPDLLRVIAVTTGLSWELSTTTVTLTLEPPPGTPGRAASLLAVARRALRDAIVTYPDHPLVAAAYLELGNLEAHEGHWKEAIVWYERMLRELPRSEILVEANYNLAVAQSRLSQRAAARNSFYWVVDRSPGHELALLACLKIGRLYLEDNDPAGATRPLRRAMAAAPQSHTLAGAAVTLAAACLLTDNPRAARAALREARDSLTAEPFRSTAAFLDALARYRLLPETRRGNRESGEVLAAILAFRQPTILGPAGALLIGRAYRDLGMVEEMAATYETALQKVDCPLALEMTADLADYLYRTGRRGEARPRYEALASQSSKHAFHAELRLAEIALQEHHLDDCLQRCRKLLREHPAADLTPVLQVMGKAFAQKGDYEKSAQCFAGKVPEVEGTKSSPRQTR